MILCKNRFFGIRTPRSTLPAKQSVRSRTTFKPSFLKVFILGLNVSGKFSGSLELSIAVTLVARIGLVWKSQSEFNVWISAMLYITVSFVTFLLSILSRFLFGVESPENGPHISCKKNTFEHNYFTDFLFIFFISSLYINKSIRSKFYLNVSHLFRGRTIESVSSGYKGTAQCY